MSAGTVLLLAQVDYADGEPHAYRFTGHPMWANADQVKVVFHADDFYEHWERAPDGEAIRAAELAELLQQIEQTKTKLMQDPPEALGVRLLGVDAPDAEPGNALATQDSIDAMTAYAHQLQRDAELRTNWIQTNSKKLGEQGTQMARFHSERAQAALARAKVQLDGVKGLLKTADNLRLYVGEGVEVVQLLDGAPAASNAPLTIYQELLAFDEETLILLDQGGIDHTHTQELAKALADPALLNRMIPSSRGMVLCRFRSSYKEFVPGESLASAMANAQLNQAAREKLLLLRDAERVWLVYIENVLEAMKQLLPSTGEQDRYFSGSFSGDRITREDIDYAAAQRRQIGMLDRYGQVLIALWGLHDRTGLFEDSDIPRFANWLEPGFQLKHLALVSLDNLIGVERPSFATWQQKHNAYLAPGAWVAVCVRQAFNQSFTPVAWGSNYQIYYPDLPDGSGAFIERVQRDAEGLFVQAPMIHERTDRRIKGKLYLRRFRRTHQDDENHGFLVLDRALSSDLDYYLTSRKERRSYAEYVQLFREARTWTEARDASEAPLRDQLREAVLAAAVPHDPDLLEDRITEAVAIARSERRGGKIPEAGSAAFTKFWKGALDNLHALLTGHDARIAAVEAWSEANQRVPLRLSLSGGGAWILYLEPSEHELDAALGPVAHVSEALIEFTVEGLQVLRTKRTLLRARANEQVVHDWGTPARVDFDCMPCRREPATGSHAWLERVPPFQMEYQAAAEALAFGSSVSALPVEIKDPAVLLENAVRHMRTMTKSKAVARMWVYVPIGSVLQGDVPRVLFAAHDAIALAYHLGDEGIKQEALRQIDGIYRYPESHLKRLPNEAWRTLIVRLDQLIKDSSLEVQQNGWAVEPEAFIKASEGGEKRDRMFHRPDLTLTHCSELGYELFPWLRDCKHA